jgi:hypothetical protein
MVTALGRLKTLAAGKIVACEVDGEDEISDARMSTSVDRLLGNGFQLNNARKTAR